MTALWEQLEEWITEEGLANGHFNAVGLAASLECSVRRATNMIQSHLDHQTCRAPRSVYVITRQGRCQQSVWHVGNRALDAYNLGAQTGDDIRYRVKERVMPTLERIALLNPRALPRAQVISAALDYNVGQLEAMLATEH